MSTVFPYPRTVNPSPLRHSLDLTSGDAIDAVLSSVRIGSSTDRWARALSARNHHDTLTLSNCQVLAVEHRKNSKGAEHEYLLFTLRCKGPSSGRMYTRYLRTDRSFQHDSPVLHPHKHLLRGGSLPADDTIHIELCPFKSDSYTLYKMTFDNEMLAPNILDLAALLQAVASLSSQYHLYTFMCYWHARTVYDALRVRFRGRQQEGERPHSRGRYAGGWAMISNEEGQLLMTKRFSILRIGRRTHDLEMPTLPKILAQFDILRRKIGAGTNEAVVAAASGGREHRGSTGETAPSL